MDEQTRVGLDRLIAEFEAMTPAEAKRALYWINRGASEELRRCNRGEVLDDDLSPRRCLSGLYYKGSS